MLDDQKQQAKDDQEAALALLGALWMVEDWLLI